MSITVVTGPPCSGKSTLVRDRAHPDDVVLDFDAIAQAIGAKTAHASAGSQREVAHVMRHAAIARVLEGIDAPAWIIHTWPSAEQLALYAAAGAELIELDPGLDVALARAEADNRPPGTFQAIASWYNDRKALAMTLELESPVQHRTKAFAPLRFKAEGELDLDGAKLGPGEFTALAAVFNNIDSYGDRMVKGAFAETLAEWEASGDPIPIIWQHLWSDPSAHIGYVLEARETDEGLWYKGRLDIEDNPFAAQVYRLMKGRRVRQQSFGFDVVDGRAITEDEQSIFEILKVRLYEVGPCLVGVNQATNVLDIKGAPAAPSTSAGAPAPAEATSGQAAPAAGDEAASVPTASVPTLEPASKGYGPASVLLLTEQLALEGGKS